MPRFVTICMAGEVMKICHSFSGFSDVEKGKAISKLFEFQSNFNLWFKGGGKRTSLLIKMHLNELSLGT